MQFGDSREKLAHNRWPSDGRARLPSCWRQLNRASMVSSSPPMTSGLRRRGTSASSSYAAAHAPAPIAWRRPRAILLRPQRAGGSPPAHRQKTPDHCEVIAPFAQHHRPRQRSARRFPSEGRRQSRNVVKVVVDRRGNGACNFSAGRFLLPCRRCVSCKHIGLYAFLGAEFLLCVVTDACSQRLRHRSPTIVRARALAIRFVQWNPVRVS